MPALLSPQPLLPAFQIVESTTPSIYYTKVRPLPTLTDTPSLLIVPSPFILLSHLAVSDPPPFPKTLVQYAALVSTLSSLSNSCPNQLVLPLPPLLLLLLLRVAAQSQFNAHIADVVSLHASIIAGNNLRFILLINYHG